MQSMQAVLEEHVERQTREITALYQTIARLERGNEGDLTDTDCRRGFRRMIDAAMAVQPTPTGDTP